MKLGLGVVALAFAGAGFGSGCGDDSAAPASAGDGCTTDVECKGDRICVDRECVDPEEAPGGDDGGVSDSGTSTGSGGPRAGSSGGGGGTGSEPEGGPSAGRGGASGGAGRPAIDDPALEEACSLNCEARKAAACEMDIGSLDQCLAQCLTIDEVNNGYCLDEQREQYACLASGGYSCISGYPQQKATCTQEALALSECSQMAPCRMYCEEAAGVCAPEGDACLIECFDMQQNGFADTICGIYYTQLVSCWGLYGACDGDMPAVGQCASAIAEVADCIGSRTEECEGFCWAAEMLGCAPSDCVESCTAKTADASCGSYYDRVIDCGIGSHALNISCNGSQPVVDPTGCASELMQYATCQ